MRARNARRFREFTEYWCLTRYRRLLQAIQRVHRDRGGYDGSHGSVDRSGIDWRPSVTAGLIPAALASIDGDIRGDGTVDRTIRSCCTASLGCVDEHGMHLRAISPESAKPGR